MQLTVSYSRDGDVQTIDTGGPLGTLIIDNAQIPEDRRGGLAKQLLGSSAVLCYCAALGAAMKSRGVEFSELKATAKLDVNTNSKGQSRVLKIAIDASVNISEEDADVFERIIKIMNKGCLITGSLHDGIQMEYNLNSTYEEN